MSPSYLIIRSEGRWALDQPGPTFSVLLKTHRENKGLSFRALAEKVPFDHSYIVRFESGERKPPDREGIIQIAKALEADVDEFLISAGLLPENFSQYTQTPLSVWGAVPHDWEQNIPTNTPHPPETSELEALRKFPLRYDMGNKDPRKDVTFWYYDPAKRRRILRNEEATWEEFKDDWDESEGVG